MKTLFKLVLGMMMTASNPATADKVSYLALGDSYTVGQSVAAAQSWPMQLTHELTKRGQELQKPHIIAVTGWTTDELAAGIKDANLDRCHDLVSLSIGVNNQYRHRDLDNYRLEYGQLLEQAIELAGGNRHRVFVLSIPDWSATPFGQGSGRNLQQEAAQLAAYNQAKREITEARGVLYLDITPSTLEAANDASLSASDGLHPSAKLYAIWVEQIIDSVQALLDSPTGC